MLGEVFLAIRASLSAISFWQYCLMTSKSSGFSFAQNSTVLSHTPTIVAMRELQCLESHKTTELIMESKSLAKFLQPIHRLAFVLYVLLHPSLSTF